MRRIRKCPNCGSKELAKIIYGIAPPPMQFRVFNGKVVESKAVAGGCCVTDDDPDLQCLDCEFRIFPDGRYMSKEEYEKYRFGN